MEKKDFLHNFLDTYKTNRDLNDEWNEKLLTSTSLADWTITLKERSEKLRFIYGEMEEQLATIRDLMRESLTEDDAEMLFDVVTDLYYSGYNDFELMSAMANRLIQYYEMRNDLEHRVFLYYLMGFETTEFYSRTMGYTGAGVAVDYYQRVISLKAHYVEIVDPRIRECFFTAYANLIFPMTEMCPFLQESVFDYYEAALELYENPAVQTLDGDKAFLQKTMDRINADILCAESFADKLGDRQRGQFIKIARQAKRDLDLGKRTDESGGIMRAHDKAMFILGEKSAKQIVEEQISHLINELRLPNYKDVDNYDREIYVFRNYHDTAKGIIKYLELSDFTPEERKEYARRILNKVTHVHQTAPYSFHTSMVNSDCADWFKLVERYLDNREEKRNFLSKIILLRQPITYLHSLMVMQLSQVITNVYLWANPEEFVGVLGCKNVDEVKEKAEDIKRFVADCGLLHDIGKSLITDVVNQQWRALCGEEQDLIRLHPEKGLMLVNEDPDFAPYFDAIVGHHKYYNGKGGYPVAYDNTKSPIKVVVDIVSIADTIDAATDIWCRNYTKGKPFQELLQEMTIQGGTRYHPQIVKLLNDNSGIQSLIEYLTGDGRVETYFTAYREIMAL